MLKRKEYFRHNQNAFMHKSADKNPYSNSETNDNLLFYSASMKNIVKSISMGKKLNVLNL